MNLQTKLPGVGVVIPTIGETHRLGRLFESLTQQDEPPLKVVVVVQDNMGAVARAIAPWTDSLDVTQLTCPRGAARARNVGVAALPADCTAVTFLDDDVWLDHRALGRMAGWLRYPRVAVSGALAHADGTPYRKGYSTHPELLDAASVWRNTYETTTAFNRDFWELAGPLDERLGLGSGTRWQSGEGTDFLLQGMRRGGRVVFDPCIRLFEDAYEAGSPRLARRRLQAYARGTGAVYSRHYGPARAVRMMAGPLVRMAIHGARRDAEGVLTDAAVWLGRMEGYVTGKASLGRAGDG